MDHSVATTTIAVTVSAGVGAVVVLLWREYAQIRRDEAAVLEMT